MATTWSKESQTKAASTGSTADTSFQLDSSQSFLIKNSSASNIFTFAESTGDLTITGDITVSGNNLVCNTLTAATGLNLNSGTGDTGYDITLNSYDSITNVLDTGGGSTSYFKVQQYGDSGNTTLLTVDESGNTTVLGDLTITGGNITNAITFDATISPASHVDMPDSANIKLGAADDMQLYHDGSNSYITNKTGALKIATETSGIAVTIGHTTSETTIADNLTVTGTINGVTLGVDSDSVLVQSTSASSGTSNTIFGKNAGDSIASGGNYNTLFGEDAGTAITTGDNNVIVGYGAGKTITTTAGCILIGKDAASTITADDNDAAYTIAIGHESLLDLSTGQKNIAIGFQSGTNATTSDYSTFVGYESAHGNDSTALTGNHNTTLGYRAGYLLEGAAASNTIIGSVAGDAMTTTTNCVLIGYAAGGAINSTDANGSVAIGYNALLANTDGRYNLAIGQAALVANQQGDANVAIGYKALNNYNAESAGEGHNVAIGKDAGFYIEEGQYNTAIGSTAIYSLDGDRLDGDENTAVGYRAGRLLQGAATKNTLVGAYCGDAITTGVNNTCMGRSAGTALNTGQENIFIGDYAGNNTTTGQYNISIGSATMATNVDGDKNVAIGYKALYTFEANSDGEGRNTCIGYNSGYYISTGEYNTFLGADAGDGASGAELTGDANVCIGDSAGAKIQGAADSNVIVGTSAVGAGAFTGDDNVCVGYQSGYDLTSGQENVFIGFKSGYNVTTGQDNIAIGKDSFFTSVANGDGCVAIGNGALYTFNADSDGHGNNVAIGKESGYYISTGTENTFVGRSSGLGITGTPITGNNNTCLGYNSGLELEGAAHSNTLIGALAGNTTEAGVENTCLGYNCEAQDDTATNQIVIGNNLTGTKDNAVFIGNDTSHIENDFNSDATWNHSSDVRQKTDIKDDVLGLDFINNLKTRTYKHKSPSEFPKEWTAYDPDDKEPMGGDRIIHGFIAQEVKEALDNADIDTFQGWSEGIDGRQRVSFEAFVLPLIKAVQELSNEVDKLKEK